MELKVWVEGIQRIVCGVTVNTTCQDVVFALAHATGKVGRFTLIERWRNNERLLAPNENPLKLLLKWGEYANDVQFILQRSENKQQSSQHQPRATTNTNDNNNTTIISNTNISNNENRNPQTQAVIIKKPLGLSNTNNSNTINNTSHNNNNNNIEKKQHQNQQQQQQQHQQKELNLQAASERTKELKKSFGAYDKHIENIGIVKGIPQQKQQIRLMNHNSNNINSNNNNITTNMIAKYSPTNNNVTIKSTTITATTAASFNSKQNTSSIPHIIPKHEKSHSNPIEMTNSNNNSSDYQQMITTKSSSNVNNNNSNNIYSQLGAHNSKSINEINLAEVRESLSRRTVTPTSMPPITIPTTSTIANINNKEIFYSNVTTNHNNNNTSPAAITATTTTKFINNNQFSSEENLLDIYSSSNIRYNNSNNNNNNNSSNKNSNNKTSNSPSIAVAAAAAAAAAANELSASPDLYKNTTPTISANGALVPPPYRNPPPPRNSPLQRMQTDANNMSHSPAMSSGSGSGSGSVSAVGSGSATHQTNTITTTTTTSASAFLNDYTNVYEDDFQLYATPIKNNSTNNNNNTKNNNKSMLEESESIFQATQYNDLLQLIKFQREKISAQQLELTKYDAEIIFLETKERDQAQELEAISREITKADQIFRQGSEQLQALQYVEEENELVKQQEKTLKSEIALLRSKLANCETELLQCKNKIRLLMDDIEIEQRALTQKQKSTRQNFERDFLMEMERIQNDIDQAIMNTDTSNKTAENLKKEIMLIEQAIAEKKRQVEKLVNEMKEVNLQSLQVTTSEEIKNLLEGPNKQGSSRRIIGSPRQLENAVPTSKNPHGVWV